MRYVCAAKMSLSKVFLGHTNIGGSRLPKLHPIQRHSHPRWSYWEIYLRDVRGNGFEISY